MMALNCCHNKVLLLSYKVMVFLRSPILLYSSSNAIAKVAWFCCRDQHLSGIKQTRTSCLPNNT